MRQALLGLALLLASWGAQAACSGSGLTWTCTAGSSAANLNSAISSASDGATITLDDGSYSFSGVDLTTGGQNGVTIICESVRGCTISGSGDTFVINYCNEADITGLVRVSGFIFSGAPSTGKIWFYCSDGNNIDQVRIDNNSFTNFAGSQAVFFGEQSKEGDIHGVVDSNIFTSTNNGMALKNISGGTDWEIGLQGGAGNVFFEDNEITFTNNNDLGLGASDSWRAGGTVLRFNTLAGSRFLTHSLCHGGPVNWEVYNNDISNSVSDTADDYRNLHSQGSGEMMIFDNVVTNANGNAIALQHYRSDSGQMPQGSCTAAEICDGDWTAVSGIPLGDGNRSGEDGYPCWHQPGRDDNATLRPFYSFMNRTPGGTRIDVTLESGGLIASHIVENRDYYESVSASAQSSATSPFNGTAGVGHGTLSNRPTTCTTNATAADSAGCAGSGCGVGYWATDGGSNWNTSNGAGNDGGLYICSDTNTWTLYYTPYTYPHPLRGEGGGDVPSPPTNFRILSMLTAIPLLGVILGGLYGKGIARTVWDRFALRTLN